jgi:putative membrane protein
MSNFLAPVLQKNDRQAALLIWIFSIVVFAAVVALGAIKLKVEVGFNVHVFATINAGINTIVTILLAAALVAVKLKKYALHKKIMLAAMLLSILFLVSYICHHLLAGDTKYGGEGTIRYVYFFILSTHIFLAAIILPFILFTAYRALIAEFPQHKKLARITWPIWFYVSMTGVIVYLFISPYYH